MDTKNRKIRVLLLNYEFPPLGGGAAHATYNILQEFKGRKDIHIDLVTTSTGRYREEALDTNVNVYYLDIGKKKKNIHSQSQLELLKYSWKAFRFSKRLKRKYKYDLIHAFFGIPCGFLALRLKLPYIVSLRGSDVPFYSEKYKVLDKLFFKNLSKNHVWKKAKAVITNSEGLKELALKTNPNQEIGVIYNGVNIEEFCPISTSPKEFTVISTSRFLRRKGIEHLIDAFARFVRTNDCGKLVLVGSGDLENEYREQVQQLGVQDRVEFTGPVSHKEIPSLYRKADVFVLPSLNEGMSNSLLEALASGLAVIATDTGGTKELVGDENGTIVKMQSSQDILKALERIHKDKGLLERMKLASRNRAEKMSWSRVAEEYINEYKKCIF